MTQQHRLTHGIGNKLLKALAEAGLSEQAARIVVDDETGKLAKGMIGSLGFIPNNQRADLAEAKKLFGREHFFGPSEWLEHYGPIFSLPVAPKIPWKKETLQEFAKTHFLFLKVKTLAGVPVTIRALGTLQSGAKHPKIAFEQGDNWYCGEKFANRQIEFGWSLVPLKAQIVGVPYGHSIQDGVTRTMANILVHINTGEYLDQNEWVLTSDVTNRGQAVYLTGSHVSGVRFYPPDVPASQFGYALEREPDGI